ncbi:MAG: polyamine aminopropyltransferase [Acholeplasmataceae bacterium]|nr:polyamine aminopropyltransferase [Acholeplasmataceae bacterium]
MEWFTENWTPNIKFSVRIKEHLHSETTPFQQLEVYDSFELGRFFTLDGIMMANEKDEFIYHEMIVHTPMSINQNIKHVLVIGGGDGGSVRELTKYQTIESIDMVEIDERVVRVCQEYFTITTTGLNDPRVSLKFEDGLAYVKNTQKVYDLIIVDSTDPIGPGGGLFSMEFYTNCKRILAEDGILINQHESPYFEKESTEMKRAHKKIKSLFPIAEVYQAFIPTYPSGHWLFGFASKKYHPIKDFKKAHITSLGLETKYYNGDVHQGSFALPNYVRNALKEV